MEHLQLSGAPLSKHIVKINEDLTESRGSFNSKNQVQIEMNNVILGNRFFVLGYVNGGLRMSLILHWEVS